MSSNTGGKMPLTTHSAKGLTAVENHTGESRDILRMSVSSECGFAPHA